MKLASDVDLNVLIAKVRGYSGADISNVCRDAAMMPLRNAIATGKLSITEIANKRPDEIDAPITQKDFLEAIANVSKSVSNDLLEQYQSWMDEFGCV